MDKRELSARGGHPTPNPYERTGLQTGCLTNQKGRGSGPLRVVRVHTYVPFLHVVFGLVDIC